MVMGPNKKNSSRAVPPPNNFLRREICKSIKKKMRNISGKHLGEWLQEISTFINLPSQVLPNPNMQPQYRLQFINKVRNPSFTTNLVRDDNGYPIKVAINDKCTQSIISPDNFLSSAKVRLTVLNAEFLEIKGETLSRGEFNQSVLKERERKGPILTGRSRIIQLQNGVGTFENIVFNDNSSWTKSGFRLGVMVVSDGEEGYFNGERVQEGVSEPFRVKDRRMKASQKPDRLKLTHKVQSLKKVGKDRASLLQKKNINTVEDFLKFYYNDEAALREILCIKSESGKEWDSMVEHATQCADEFHAKYNALNNSSQPQQVSMDEEVNILDPISNNINALVHPMVRNMSLCTNSGLHVVGLGSSEPNPFENKIIEGDIPANYGQLSPICDSSSMNVLNEHISTASVDCIVETKPALFLETYRTNDERGNILNENLVHHTNGIGFPKLELSSDLISMKNLYADAESSPNYNTQVSSRGGFMSSANLKNYMRPPYPRFRGRITLENHYQKHEFSVWS
ncbi:calmodulin-binding protein 60 B-like [Carex rostrata]